MKIYFRKKTILIFLTLIIQLQFFELKSQDLSRDLKVEIFINQAGYPTISGKFCVVNGKTAASFEVIDIETQKIVQKGSLLPCPDDLGDYLMGDFSALTEEGHYYLKSGSTRSYPFEVSNSVYKDPINLIVQYFSKQRCGASTTGYLSPCHLDDGVRLDNGRYQNVTGGWHDASDLRKWIDATIYGMIGLSKVYELIDGPDINKDKILEELMWGNEYFLRMQEPDGYIMNFIGGDVKRHADSNRWTDNVKGKEEGEVKIVKPVAGLSSDEMLIIGSKDDRIIQTEPADMVAQYNFIASEAMMARITKFQNIGYSQKCLNAAKECFEWCDKNKTIENPAELGASIQASVQMYKTTDEDVYKDFAVKQALQLEKLQVNSPTDSISGFFLASHSNQEPYKDIWKGCLAFIALSDLIHAFPDHEKVPLWKEMVFNYTNLYLSKISHRNAFGIVPYGLYSEKDPGGNRKIGNYWYRYFMQPDLDWWVGINANLASAGVGLIKAAKVLNDKKLKIMAQRQLDWILGTNPFNGSTFIAVGYNHPKQFVNGSEFLPATPILAGAVMNGLGGNKADQPVIGSGDWQISEYWTPMVSFTLWLMAEISRPE